MQTLATLIALTACGQVPDQIVPESIPAPSGLYLNGAIDGAHEHYHNAPFTVERPAQFAYPTGHIYPDVAPEGIYGPRRCDGWVYPNGVCGHRCVKDPHSWGNWWIPPGNMLPHYHYQAAEHGYRCFEPHNVTRVAMQQSFVKSYGGDHRHPYSNEVFQRVYEIYGKRHGADRDDELPPIAPIE